MRRPSSAAASRAAAVGLSEALVASPRSIPGRRLRRVGTSSCTLAEGSSDNAAGYKSIERRLIAGLVIAAIFMAVEAVGGFWAHSIAIWTDAAHLLSDVSGFAVALVAARIASRAAAGDHTFGFHRIEVLGALASVAMTWFVTGILVIEAAGRVAHPKPVDGRLMFILAAAGVGVNLLLMAVLGGHHHHGAGGGHDHGHGHGEEGGGGGHSHSHSNGGGCGGGHAHARAHAPRPRPSQPGDELAPVSTSGSGSGATTAAGVDDDEEEDDMEKGPAMPALVLAPPGAAAAGAAASAPPPAAAHAHSHSHAHDAHRHSINIRGAVLHVLGDMVQSLGVMLAGALIWGLQATHPRVVLADPLATFFFALLVLLTTRAILRDIFDILMERAPKGLAPAAVEAALAAAPGVAAVHDLHLWVLKPSVIFATAHVTPEAGCAPGAVLGAAKAALAGLGITHVTVQVESEGEEEEGEDGEGRALLA